LNVPVKAPSALLKVIGIWIPLATAGTALDALALAGDGTKVPIVIRATTSPSDTTILLILILPKFE
jgi:predicted secreted protein